MLTAVLDTCVLYPQHLTDTLLRLAASDLYCPVWSPDILTELHRNLTPRIGPAATHRRISRMQHHFPDAAVTGYQSLVSAMPINVADRHVLAAAVASPATVLVTYNLADFPASVLQDYALQAQHPDEFLSDQWSMHPTTTLACIQQQVAGYRRQPTTVSGLAEFFRTHSGLPRFADALDNQP